MRQKKTQRDPAIAEVRAARTALCARFGNDPSRLLEHLRQRQRHYRDQVIKNWSQLQPAPALAETPQGKKKAKP